MEERDLSSHKVAAQKALDDAEGQQRPNGSDGTYFGTLAVVEALLYVGDQVSAVHHELIEHRPKMK